MNEQLGRARVRLGARPPDDRALRLLGEQLFELRARFLGGDDDQLGRPHPPSAAVELLGDLAEMLAHELLDVPLIARL
jgi:hypothetical protein